MSHEEDREKQGGVEPARPDPKPPAPKRTKKPPGAPKPVPAPMVMAPGVRRLSLNDEDESEPQPLHAPPPAGKRHQQGPSLSSKLQQQALSTPTGGASDFFHYMILSLLAFFFLFICYRRYVDRKRDYYGQSAAGRAADPDGWTVPQRVQTLVGRFPSKEDHRATSHVHYGASAPGHSCYEEDPARAPSHKYGWPSPV